MNIAYRVQCEGDDNGKSFDSLISMALWLVVQSIQVSVYEGNYEKHLFTTNPA